MSKDGLVKISKLEHNAIYGRKFMDEFNRTKDKLNSIQNQHKLIVKILFW